MDRAVHAAPQGLPRTPIPTRHALRLYAAGRGELSPGVEHAAPRSQRIDSVVHAAPQGLPRTPTPTRHAIHCRAAGRAEQSSSVKRAVASHRQRPHRVIHAGRESLPGGLNRRPRQAPTQACQDHGAKNYFLKPLCLHLFLLLLLLVVV